MSKLHTLGVVRGVIASDKELRSRYDAYHKEHDDGWVWDDERVIRAASRAMSRKVSSSSDSNTISFHDGETGPDLVQLGVNINAFVNGITAGLENEDK